MKDKSNIYIEKEDDCYVASSIETGIASQGRTIEEAKENLEEALSLYYETDYSHHKVLKIPQKTHILGDFCGFKFNYFLIIFIKKNLTKDVIYCKL